MQAKAVKEQMREVIGTIGCLTPRALAARGARELADREREAVDDGEPGVVGDLVADPLPVPVLHHLQIRRLPDKRRTVEMGERGEEVPIVPVK